MTVVAFLFIVTSALDGYAQNIQVNFGVTFRNARLAPLWIAEEKGYFKKQGLEVRW